MSDVQQTLHDRGASHGDFANNAIIALALRELISNNLEFKRQPLRNTEAAVTEALNAVAGKFARILAGDALLIDHWRDMVGYAELAIKQLKKDPAALDVRTESFCPAEPLPVEGALVEASFSEAATPTLAAEIQMLRAQVTALTTRWENFLCLQEAINVR